MQLGKIIGNVVATRRADGLGGQRLLLLQPIDHAGRNTDTVVVAVDTVQAGPGDRVNFVTSREAAQALDDDFVPVDAAIVGVVDAVNAGDVVNAPALDQGAGTPIRSSGVSSSFRKGPAR